MVAGEAGTTACSSAKVMRRFARTTLTIALSRSWANIEPKRETQSGGGLSGVAFAMPQCAVLSIRNNAAKQVLLSLGELLVRNLLIAAVRKIGSEERMEVGVNQRRAGVSPTASSQPESFSATPSHLFRSGGFLKKKFDAADRIAST